jgi:hypothetical protein
MNEQRELQKACAAFRQCYTARMGSGAANTGIGGAYRPAHTPCAESREECLNQFLALHPEWERFRADL